jgi:ketosteroid isomerase-like protein
MGKIEQLRERFLAAVAATDVAAILANYHDDALLVAPEGSYQGRDYIEAYYRQQFDAFQDAVLTIHATHECGNVGIAEWTMSAVSTGAFELPGAGTVPPTRQHVTQRGADIAVVEDGRIREHRLYYDQLELIDQLRAPPSHAAGSV